MAVTTGPYVNVAPVVQRPQSLQWNGSPLFNAAWYLALLIVPWVYICNMAKGDIEVKPFYRQLFPALNFLQTLVSLPIIYYLLSRAAVVYAQRTSKRSKLNVRQLFTLADRKWFTAALVGKSHGGNKLAVAAAGLILVVFALPIVRAPLVTLTTEFVPLSLMKEFKISDELPLAVRTGFQYHRNPWDIGHWVDSENRPGPNSPFLARSTLLRPKVVGVDAGRDRIAQLPTEFLTNLVRNALIHYHPADRAERNWHDPETGRLFASTVVKGTNTGLFRQHAMRLNSSATCTSIDFEEFFYKCPPSARNEHLSLQTSRATLHVCTGKNVTGTPSFFKNPEQDGRFQIKNITEVAYINMTYTPLPYFDGRSVVDGTERVPHQRLLRCTGATTLGYFELGNRYNSGQHGPLVSARSNRSELWTMDGVIRDTRVSQIGGSPYQDWDLSHVYQNTQLGLSWPSGGIDEDEEQNTSRTPEPLLLTLHALFGQGSVFRLAQDLAPLTFTNSSSSSNPEETLYNVICQSRPFPFRRLDEHMAQRCPYYYLDKSITWNSWADEKLFQLTGLLGRSEWLDIDFAGKDAKMKYIEMAMHLASQTIMDAATYPGYDSDYRAEEVDQIWTMEADDVLRFQVSDPAMIALSVLVAVQAVGILGLLWYIYRAPTWTSTLDAMAIARITHQIKDNGLIKGMGLRHPTKEEWAYLAGVDALVGLSKGGESIEFTSPVNGARSTAAAAAVAPLPSPGLLSAERPGHTATPSIRTSPPSEQSMAVSPVSPLSPGNPQALSPSSAPSSRRQSFTEADLEVDNHNANNDDDDNLPPAYSPRGAPPVEGQAGFLDGYIYPHSPATSQVGIIIPQQSHHQQQQQQHEASLPPLIPPPNPFEEVEEANRQTEARRRRAAGSGARPEDISVRVGGEGLIDRQARKRAKLGLIRTVEGG
ncbi:hypothetical protein B0T20DRAFT_395201 [Sordaria brevicollis]|uniref:Uncharacterized protein n=1 Tax=Sordaria brevicollis TaxID=83679 RepID=A0AAE0PBA3_SORBR|nr:hypothetical protein B0T20DRAFT_395201 [Sordaria brevicollis]